jgi:hypothetical protein
MVSGDLNAKIGKERIYHGNKGEKKLAYWVLMIMAKG